MACLLSTVQNDGFSTLLWRWISCGKRALKRWNFREWLNLVQGFYKRWPKNIRFLEWSSPNWPIFVFCIFLFLHFKIYFVIQIYCYLCQSIVCLTFIFLADPRISRTLEAFIVCGPFRRFLFSLVSGMGWRKGNFRDHPSVIPRILKLGQRILDD